MQHRHREVALRTVGTARDTHGVVLLNVIRKQQVKPVGVAELSILQITVAGSLGVLQTELACCGVVLTQLLVHITIDTGILGIHYIL